MKPAPLSRAPAPDVPDAGTGAAPVEAVVIGASAGAVEALSLLLPALPKTFPVPVVVVVHVPPDRPSALVELFEARCQLTVKEAEDKEPLTGRTVYFAPPDYHVLVEPDRYLSLSADPPVLYSRPSIDVLFESAADAYGAGLIGVVLTGANNDGAEGLRAVCAAGGVALVQDPEEALVSTMPRAALGACPDARAFPLQGLVTYLCRAAFPARS